MRVSKAKTNLVGNVIGNMRVANAFYCLHALSSLTLAKKRTSGLVIGLAGRSARWWSGIRSGGCGWIGLRVTGAVRRAIHRRRRPKPWRGEVQRIISAPLGLPIVMPLAKELL
jgi:hypothetical protein